MKCWQLVYEDDTYSLSYCIQLNLNTVWETVPYIDMHTNRSVTAVNGSRLKAWVQVLAAARGNLVTTALRMALSSTGHDTN
jgi:hypothetical protein